jgi:heterodisulfide reductase subunit A-like polyferredoxin
MTQHKHKALTKHTQSTKKTFAKTKKCKRKNKEKNRVNRQCLVVLDGIADIRLVVDLLVHGRD